MTTYPEISEHSADLWRMIGYAAKYGNQPLPVLLASTAGDLTSFNNGIMYWIEKENAGTKGTSDG